MPDSADGAFNEQEDRECLFEEAYSTWEDKDCESKVIYVQERLGDEQISDLIENDSSLMEQIYAKLVADGLNA